MRLSMMDSRVEWLAKRLRQFTTLGIAAAIYTGCSVRSVPIIMEETVSPGGQFRTAILDLGDSGATTSRARSLVVVAAEDSTVLRKQLDPLSTVLLWEQDGNVRLEWTASDTLTVTLVGGRVKAYRSEVQYQVEHGRVAVCTIRLSHK